MKFINIKKLLLFFIPLVTLGYFAIDHYYQVITENELEIIKNGAVNDLETKGIFINDVYKYLATDIDIIQWQYDKDFNKSLQPKKKNLVDFFLHLSNLQTTYDQVRFIDTLGNEIIRVDFDSINTAKIKEFNKLQDKSKRKYFKRAKELEKDEIYFSDIDLNMEYGKIEIPYKPVLRVAKKVYNTKGEWNGVIVINYFINNLFSKLTNQNNLHYTSFELRNAEGFPLISEGEKITFSHILSNSDSLNFRHKQKELWEKVNEKNAGIATFDSDIYVFKKLTINSNSTKNIHYKGNKSLLLIHKIDLQKVKDSQFIYVIYERVCVIIISILLLIILLLHQYFIHKLEFQNEKLLTTNDELIKVKKRIEETLNIKLDELKLTEKKFYSIFNNAGIGIALLDLKGKPLFTNKKFSTILGYSEKEFTKTTFADFTHPDDLEKDLNLFEKLINREIESYHIEKRYIRKDGITIWGNLDVSLLVDEDNNIINVIGVVTDITERIDAQTETKNLKKIIHSLNYIAKVLNIDSVENIAEINESVNLVKYIEKQSDDILQANKAREILLKNLEFKNAELNNYAHIVSHDLKTPLQGIYTLSKWIEEETGNKLTDESKMYFQLILDNLEKMESLIDGILNYSSIDNNEVSEYEINTYELVNDIVKLIPIPKSIEIKVDKNLPIIKSNKSRIHQVFQNLLQNAIKSITNETGTIEIGARETPKLWEFYVKDNGKGIDKKYFKKIFELFQSIDDDPKSLGMGLSIVKKVIDFYKGEIWLESEVSKGSIFYFTLPK